MNEREKGWRSGETTRLPPMWPGFESWCCRHMWGEFVVGLSLDPRGFSPGTPVFFAPNPNSIWNARTRFNEFFMNVSAPWVNKLHLQMKERTNKQTKE